MVAMLGWIIPEPLHIPPTRTVTPSRSSSTAWVFGRVSVVMIARAAASPARGTRWLQASAMPRFTASIGRYRPITPVVPTSTWSGSRSSRSAVSLAIWSASRKPCAPVQALAFPEQTTIACTRLFFRCSRSITTLALFTLLVVKTPPASQTRSLAMTVRSSRWSPGMAAAPAV
jgi:hypothetical protein